MAYVNVKDWSVEQVMYWLKGLDNVILQYQAVFLNNGVKGHQLLNFRADDLDNLGIKKLGHQEIILEAVEHLRHFHYELDKENLQMLALKLSCTANSLYKELLLIDEKCDSLKTQVMSDVHNIIAAAKPLVLWLDRAPFTGDKDYIDSKRDLLSLSFEMAYIAHRGVFSENPVPTIKKICDKFAKIADHIIQEVCDPMILQPASLDLAKLKKKEQELGFYIMPNYHPIHQIVDIKFGSPAHGSSKIEEGDEIVQVNYQTVVGWQAKKVMLLLQEVSPEIVLTLKKRPRHSKVYGQIYMKPYRLPSRKRSTEQWSKWTENLPSPRLLPMDLPHIKIIQSEEEIHNVEAELSSSDSEPPDSPLEGNFRMYPVKPRPILQRRNTITGTTPTNKRPTTSIEEYWDLLQSRPNDNHASSSYHIDISKFGEDPAFLRDKSVSCNVGLDSSPRPTTVIGLAHSHSRKKSFKESFKSKDRDLTNKFSTRKKVNFEEENQEMKTRADNCAKMLNKVDLLDGKLQQTNLNEEKSVSVNSLSSVAADNISFIDEGKDLTDRSNMVSDLVKESSITDGFLKSTKETTKSSLSSLKDPTLAEIDVHSMIKKFDESNKMSLPKPKVMPRTQLKKSFESPQKSETRKPLVPPRSLTTKLRGRLDKSHSTPAYDLTEDDNKLESSPIKPEIYTIAKLPDVVPKIPETITEISSAITAKYNAEFLPKSVSNSTTSDANIIKDQNDLTSNISEVLPTTIEEKSEITNDELLNQLSEDIESSKDVTVTADLAAEVSVEELPPKPPPRKSFDTSKPAYPADSPKPTILPETPKGLQGSSIKKTFEFPDTSADSNKMGSTQSIKSIDSNDYLVPVQIKHVDQHLFDPDISSTPLQKYKMDHSETESSIYKSGVSYDVHKLSKESKVSPTNSIVKAMINKGKSAKKKSNLSAKRRKVTVNDLSPADIQGYLYQRLRNRQTQNVHWERRWFVLLGSCLYGFKNKDDPRAATLIFLHDFTVAVASEVKSRSNAFKVYHTGTVFYFSTEDSEALQTWLDLIRTACLPYESGSKVVGGRPYSETDDSDSDKSRVREQEKSEPLKKFGSLKKLGLKKNPDVGHTGSTSLDRKWFFNKSSGNSKSNVPVPTAQFRSYRKIRNEPTHASVRTGNFTSHVPMFGPSNLTQAQNSSVPNLTVEQIIRTSIDSPKIQLKPTGYIHASNPSLASSLNISECGSSSKLAKDKNDSDSLSGFVTLKELMMRQSEESRNNPHHEIEQMQINLNMIKSDVVYGEVPIRPTSKLSTSDEYSEVFSTPPLSRSVSQSEKHESTSSCFGKRLGSLKRNQKHENVDPKTATYPKILKGLESKSNRSLPRTLKMQETTRECEEYTMSKIHCASDKNILSSFAKKSYEMIYCPETVNEIQFAQNRVLDDGMSSETAKKSCKMKRQPSFGLSEKQSSKSLPGFTSKVGDSSRGRLKPAFQYTPVTVPINRESKSMPRFTFELNLDEKQSKSGGKLTKIFSGKSEKKEKTFLGSPKLHRALFRKQHSVPESGWRPTAQPMFEIPSSASRDYQAHSAVQQSHSVSLKQHVDYPGLEYPPVFEPETYSLADPQSSLNLLRGKHKKECNDDEKTSDKKDNN
ncbi:hypothetical protein HUJ04_002948 [Dendroctonus ponderosae]|uniref:Connector enhancer of kinase suppressor of ras 2 n=1 Tax=Dendroctonus ponderosae TaxID=77166 RepID=A0AAR5PS14_DENPD|nr:hypothetical protein HUJ04_002948 [Dendroctonus ponderosae]